MSGICTVRAERHQRAQTQVTFDPDSSLLYFCCSSLDSQTAHQEQHLYGQNPPHIYVYQYICYIIKDFLVSYVYDFV